MPLISPTSVPTEIEIITDTTPISSEIVRPKWCGENVASYASVPKM